MSNQLANLTKRGVFMLKIFLFGFLIGVFYRQAVIVANKWWLKNRRLIKAFAKKYIELNRKVKVK